VQSPLANRKIAFAGKLGGLTKKEALQLVRDHDGIPIERTTQEVDLIVVGADQDPSEDPLQLLPAEWKSQVQNGTAELIEETELWRRLGLVDHSQNVSQLYTPAMLADLLKVPVRNIRRWQRLGLIHPVRVVHRLPYFDFEEVHNARQIASWLAAGASLHSIQKQVLELSRRNASSDRSLAQLSIIVEGRQLLLRKEEGLIEPTGQMRIDFDALTPTTPESASSRTILSVADYLGAAAQDPFTMSQEELVQYAQANEDEGNLEEAIEWYRVILARFGTQAEIHFQLAELLYRLGDISAARERYYAAIEVDEDFVEARANLGCVLAESGRLDLAIAAFRGALIRYDAYPDVHYHLARALDDTHQHEDANTHWARFIELAPGSPWLEEAQSRLANPLS